MNRDNLMTILNGMWRNGLGAPLLVVVMLSMMILPIPPLGLDLLFTFISKPRLNDMEGSVVVISYAIRHKHLTITIVEFIVDQI